MSSTTNEVKPPMSVVVEPKVNVELPKIVSPFVDNLALVTASSAI